MDLVNIGNRSKYGIVQYNNLYCSLLQILLYKDYILL